MNKTAIKNFAIWARNKLIADIQYRAGLMGITADDIKDPLPQSTGTMEFYDIGTSEPYAITGEAIPQRRKLVEVIRKKEKDSNYATAYKYILEEVAYTWFNRLIAIRFMEVNDYLPSHIRVLSSESGKIEPDLVTTPFDAELTFTSAEEEIVLRLKTENKLDELFRLLFIKQCNALNEILPALFEKTSDYTELLLNLSVVDQEGVVYHLTHDIPEQDFDITHPDDDGKIQGQVEIIGWLYQYYNTEPKNAAFAKNGKITKEEIPAVTQLFTPDWIVRYMVENSLGRIFIDKRKEQGVFADGHGLDEMSWDEVEAKRIANEEEIAGQMGWKYYLPEAAQTKEVRQQLDEIQKQSEYKDVRDIKVIDPCMGSGHILVYAFDVLMQMYENDGYSQRDAAQCILENNLYGLDIDERAAQLAYFAVMMKARQYDRRIFSRGIQPHVYAIAESNDIDAYTRDYFANNDPKLKAALNSIINDLRDAKEYGSILTVAPVDFIALYARVEQVREDISLYRENVLSTVLPLIQVAEVMAQKYDVVVTNPPYAGTKGLDIKLTNYLQEKYPMEKGDIFAAFISRSRNYSKMNGYIGMVTPTAWLYNPSYSSLRQKYLQFFEIQNLIELGANAFEVGFGTVMFVFTPQKTQNHLGIYLDVKTNVAPNIDSLNFSESHLYKVKMDYFNDYEGKKFSYKLTTPYRNILLNAFPLSHYGSARAGLQTDDNAKYIREWFEVSVLNICFHHKKGDAFGNEKWFPHIKGGTYRKWFGNLSSVVNWQYDGLEIKQNAAKKYGSYTKRVQSQDFYFVEGIAWTHTTYSQPFACRFIPEGVISNVEGPEIFELGKNQLNVMGMLNSKVMDAIFMRMSDSIHYLAGELSKFPVYLADQRIVNPIVENCVTLAMDDWNSYETSWDFQRHSLIRPVSRLADAYAVWESECAQRFLQLKANEAELNRIFIDIYGLQNELTPEVADKDVTVHRIFDTRDDVPESMQGSSYVRTKRDEIVSLLSYSVGCMFGRYSLDKQGLVFAGGDFDSVYWKFKGQAALNEQGDPIEGGYAGISLANYHYPRFHNAENWEDATLLSYEPDVDGVIPITDEEYLEDDIVSRLCDWLKAVYGSDTLEENLDFIAGALSGKGNSSREIIRNYFLKDFFKDHCKTYQKRPIYWLFDSGKKNGFKALIYMHRYQPDTIARIRTDYVHEQQARYRTAIADLEQRIANASTGERVKLNKKLTTLQAQDIEIRTYEEKIHHFADQMISIDLDDGVKKNYAIFQDVLAKIK